MRGARLILLAFCLGASLALSGCSGLDYMIEEYNSRFGIHDDRPMYPGDVGYDEKDMIEPGYHVYYSGDNHSLSIPAPVVKDATYLWQVYKDGSEIQLDGKVSSGQIFLWDIPQNLVGEDFRLRITMTVAGKTYVDEALVSVHTEVVGS